PQMKAFIAMSWTSLVLTVLTAGGAYAGHYSRSVCGTGSLPGAIHPQHDFAADGFRLVRANRVGKWELGADNGANIAGVDQSSDLLQICSPRLNDEERFAGEFVLRILLGRGDRNEPAARLQHAPRPPQGVAANGIEHCVNSLHPLLEPVDAIVDHV